jgi:hypothetical protein
MNLFASFSFCNAPRCALLEGYAADIKTADERGRMDGRV